MNLALKNFTRVLLIFFAPMAAIQTSRAQTGQAAASFPHTLLWRISGKGLQKPSYLYGTMHLNDKRLFRFDDSVYRAIEKAEGLAIEVNPDEMAAYFVNKLFDQFENGKKLQEVLDRQYFNTHRKALAKKFNKPAEEISASDVVKEKNKWMAEYMENGEMPTFMDAYLYNIARRQGKWVGGIEDINDQAGLLADLIDQADINYLLATDSSERGSESHRSIEKMISLYLNQDLDGIEGISSEHTTVEQKDKLLILRNVKMARRIDSLTSLRTMFLAIGAAHLPGDSGVISLLRRNGFTLEPVFSNKKIAAADYTFTEVHSPWVPVTDEQGNYTVEMPANAATIKLYGLIEMKFLLDLFNMSGFCTTAIMNSSHLSNRDSIFARTARGMFKDGNVKSVKSLEKNGIIGKEYLHVAKGENMRVQVFADDKMIYMALLSSVKKEMLTSADAEKFFQSFTINPQKEQTEAVISTFTDSIIGVSFTTPGRLTYNEKLSNKKDESWKISCFTGADQATGALVMLFSKEVTAGYHIPDENRVHDNFFELMQAQYSDLHKDSTTMENAKMITVTGKNIRQAGLFTRASSIVRNGRHIILIVLSDSSTLNSSTVQAVFSSFHFIRHPSVNWQKYGSPDNTFSVYAPSPVKEHFYKEGNSLQWVSYDTTTATSYLVIPDTLGKYTWYSSDSLFWKARLGDDTARDKLLEIKDVVNGSISGKEYIAKNDKNAAACSRTRLLVTGDKVYKLFAAGEKDLLYSREIDKFFSEFRINGATSPGTGTSSKAGLVLQDLGSKDSATRREAYSALSSAKFGKEDLPLLREALFRLYQSPYDTSRQTTINDEIADKLPELDDSASVTYVRASYPSLVNEKLILQNTALSVLAHQHTLYSYATLAKLMQQGPTRESLAYGDRNALEDSLALTVSLFPSILSWARDTLHAPAIAAVTLSLLDSGYLSMGSIMPAAGGFIEAAAALLPALKVNDDYDDYHLSSLLKLAGRLHTPAAYSLLRNYLAVKNKYLLRVVVSQLLDGGQPVPAAVIHRLAADPVSRSAFYSDLKEKKKTALFPKAFLTQPLFAESAIYDAAEDSEEGELEKVVFLSKRNASWKGKMYTWYLYKVTFTTDDGTRSYLGIAGGYDPAGAGVQPRKDIAGIYWEEYVNAKNAGSLFKAYLKEMKEHEEMYKQEE
jgi:uncharacterized protein YbaP (TraB family)